MTQIGQFILAPVFFSENDKRYKIRPCLVLATAMHGDNLVLLCAPESSQVHKCHGEVEVVLSTEEAEKAGLTKASVIRFSRTSLVAIMDRKVRNHLGSINDFSEDVQHSIRNAAKSVGCSLPKPELEPADAE